MSPSYTLALILCNLLLLKAAFIEKPGCDTRLWCAESCKVDYDSEDCPRNCVCQQPKRCPLVTCPAKEPICSVYTQLDRCQTCACRLPYVVVGDENTTKEFGFVFVDKEEMNKVRRSMETDKLLDGRHIMGGSMCTLDAIDKVDKCLQETIIYKESLSGNLTDKQLLYSQNPIVKFDKRDLRHLCKLYNEAKVCMTSDVFQDCRKIHSQLATLDSILGYSCGQHFEQFILHLTCIQNAHRKSLRLALCEDNTNRALNLIKGSAVRDIEEKEQLQCDSIQWQLVCEAATIQRECSSAAAQLNREALLWAHHYTNPQCAQQFKRNATKTEAFKSCSLQMRRDLDVAFRSLYKNLTQRAESKKNFAYPYAYLFGFEELLEMCGEYRNAHNKTEITTRRSCFHIHNGYSRAHFMLEYPCSRVRQASFMRSFSCLQSAHNDDHVKKCEEEATRHLEDPSNDPCETFELLVDCLYEPIVQKCGIEGWDVEFHYISYMVTNIVPQCVIQRIDRTVGTISTQEEYSTTVSSPIGEPEARLVSKTIQSNVIGNPTIVENTVESINDTITT